MVDSRAKGRTAEYKARDILKEYTGLEWERTPQSGALSYLKSDLFLPHCENAYLLEVKHYEESILDIKIFTNKSSKFKIFWEKVLEQALDRNQKSLLIFKHNRSKFYVAMEDEPKVVTNYIHISWLNTYVCLLEDWLEKEEVEWVKN